MPDCILKLGRELVPLEDYLLRVHCRDGIGRDFAITGIFDVNDQPAAVAQYPADRPDFLATIGSKHLKANLDFLFPNHPPLRPSSPGRSLESLSPEVFAEFHSIVCALLVEVSRVAPSHIGLADVAARVSITNPIPILDAGGGIQLDALPLHVWRGRS